MDENISTRIHGSLATIEQEEGVRIIYACESGSRAWEFASQNSDYDVRFLYVRPKNDYLRLDTPRDVIERPIVDDLDINGWDIFKALRLLRKSNPPLLEWLFSPIVYLENSAYIETLRAVVRRSYRTYHDYIEQKDAVVRKKYLYALRPIIALLYLQQHGKLAPTSFVQTMSAVQLSEEVREHIQQLMVLKQAGDEIGSGKPDPVLNAFISEHLSRWSKGTFSQHDQSDSQELNSLLLSFLNETDEALAGR